MRVKTEAEAPGPNPEYLDWGCFDDTEVRRVVFKAFADTIRLAGDEKMTLGLWPDGKVSVGLPFSAEHDYVFWNVNLFDVVRDEMELGDRDFREKIAAMLRQASDLAQALLVSAPRHSDDDE